jgi:hypothetical protein
VKRFDVKQGSEAWLRARMGKPTASSFDRILTPTGKPSSQAGMYCNELLAEIMLGRPLDGIKMPWMERGNVLEAEARAYYELQTGKDVETVGFCTTDDERVGASPDGLVGDDGMVEIKCPLAAQHVDFLLSTRGPDKAYFPQLQGQLYVCERQWTDIISYFPGMPEAIVRVERDEEYIKTLALHLNDFCNLLDARLEKIAARGWLPVLREEKDWLGVTEEDVNAILAGGTLA